MANHNARPANSGDMYAVHLMFRREFAALPALVRGVVAYDRTRTPVVAGHVARVVDLLHVHHRSEDEHCWPKLESRAPDEAAAIVGLMQSQHRTVDAALQRAETLNSRWLTSMTEQDREALAETVERLLTPLGEHLGAEEEQMLPLIDRYLTADEWADVGKRGLGNVPGSMVPVLFGMLLEEAASAHRALLREAVGAPVFAVMSRLGPVALKRYRRKVFATG